MSKDIHNPLGMQPGTDWQSKLTVNPNGWKDIVNNLPKHTELTNEQSQDKVTYQCTQCGKKLSKHEVHKWLGKFYCWNCMNTGNQ